MLEQILAYLHNYFEKEKIKGEFEVINGSITLDLIDGQYFRIVGSVFNDGVYQYPVRDLTDEKFEGEIWALAIPKSVLITSSNIEQWVAENPISPYVTESFGGYSYTKGTGKDGAPASWQSVFGSRLSQWRKLR